MIKKGTYIKLKEKFSTVGSFAIYDKQGKTKKSNVGNLNIFNDPNLLNVLETKYVFVGLNGSNIYNNDNLKDWSNFHSSSRYHNDYKIRTAIQNTRFIGSYMTDIIKNYHEPDSKKVITNIKKVETLLENNLRLFKQELLILESDKNIKPIIICFGNDAFNIVNENFGKEYKVFKVTHYSI